MAYTNPSEEAWMRRTRRRPTPTGTPREEGYYTTGPGSPGFGSPSPSPALGSYYTAGPGSWSTEDQVFARRNGQRPAPTGTPHSYYMGGPGSWGNEVLFPSTPTDPTGYYTQGPGSWGSEVAPNSYYTQGPGSWGNEVVPQGQGQTGQTGQPNESWDPWGIWNVFMGNAPKLDMPQIKDYSEYLLHPAYAAMVGNLFAANPYDVRRNEILEGPDAAINRFYEQGREQLMHQGGVLNQIESPAFKAQMRELETDRMLARLGIVSDWGKQAAALDEPMRQSRIQQLLGAGGTERAWVSGEQQAQAAAQQAANKQYQDYINLMSALWYLPVEQQMEILRQMQGPLGTQTSASPQTAAAILSGLIEATGKQQAPVEQGLSTAFSELLSALLGG